MIRRETGDRRFVHNARCHAWHKRLDRDAGVAGGARTALA